MVRRQHAQRSIFEMILPDGEKLWDPELRRIDEVLEEEALIEPVEEALSRRWPKSGVRGRPGTPAVRQGPRRPETVRASCLLQHHGRASRRDDPYTFEGRRPRALQLDRRLQPELPPADDQPRVRVRRAVCLARAEQGHVQVHADSAARTRPLLGCCETKRDWSSPHWTQRMEVWRRATHFI